MANDVQIIPIINVNDRIVDIKLKYTGTDENMVLQDIIANNFTCTNREKQTFPIKLTPGLVTFHCVRKDPENKTEDGTPFKVWDTASISVLTKGNVLQLTAVQISV